jgi:chromosome segregation ATPase
MSNNAESYLRVGIDGTAAQDGSRVVTRSLDDIDRSAVKTVSSLGYLKTAMAAIATVMATLKIADYVKETTMMAARNETLAVVMTKLGEGIGKTKEQMEGYAQGIAKMGITVEASREAVVKMVQAQLDLESSSKLARIAQDAAVIGGINSSEAYSRMITALATGQVEMLRSMGIMANFEGALQAKAKALGKTTEALTDQERAQARLDEVTKQGQQITGAYEASMSTVGKALHSLKRYIDDNKAAFGELFTGALTVVVNELTDDLKNMGNWLLKNKDQVQEFAGSITSGAVSAVKALKAAIDELTPAASAIWEILKWMAANPEVLITAFAVSKSAAIVAAYTSLLEILRMIKTEVAAITAMGLGRSLALIGTASVGATAATGGIIAAAGAGAWYGMNYSQDAKQADKLAAQVAADKKEQAQLIKHLEEKREIRRNHEAAEKGAEEKRKQEREALRKAQEEMDKTMETQRLKLAEANLKAEVELTKKYTEIKEQYLDYAHENQAIDDKKYYSEKMRLIQETTDKELAMYEAQYKATEDLAWKETDPKKKFELLEKMNELEAKMNETEVEALKKKEKLAMDAIKSEISQHEKLRETLVNTYDDAIAKAQEYYDKAKKIGEQIQDNEKWLENTNKKTSAKSLDQQYWDDKQALNKTVGSISMSNDAEEIQQVINSLRSFYDKYSGQQDVLGFNFDVRGAKSQVEELNNKLRALKAEDESAGDAWTRVANSQVEAIKKVDEWVEYLKKGIKDVSEYFAKTYTFTADFSKANSDLDAYLAKLSTATSAMSALNGGTNYSGSTSAGSVQSYGGNSYGNVSTGSQSYADWAASNGFALDSYASGTDYVPRTGPYILHQGEGVTPAADNKKASAGMSVSFANTYHISGSSKSSAELAREIDEEQAKLWAGGRSRLKLAIKKDGA